MCEARVKAINWRDGRSWAGVSVARCTAVLSIGASVIFTRLGGERRDRTTAAEAAPGPDQGSRSAAVTPSC
ncbi:hypothetical protein JCM4814A_89680 [Streptomyces phaeofaciens JCM 4814]